MTTIALGVPVEIGGQEVIVFRDVIGSDALKNTRENEVFTVIDSGTVGGRPPIYINEEELRQVREDYPGIAVYGLWQILFHNDQVTFGSEVIIYPMGKDSGAYIRLDRNSDLNLPSSILSSSEYVENFITELIDFDLDRAIRIDVDIINLSLPLSPAHTRKELHDKQKQEETKRWYLVAALCTCVIVFSAVVNYGLHTVYKMKMADYQTKGLLITDLDSRVAGLESERLITKPDDKEAVKTLFSIFSLAPSAVTAIIDGSVVGFSTEHRLLTNPGFSVNPAKSIKGIMSELDANLRYEIVLVPTDNGDGGEY